MKVESPVYSDIGHVGIPNLLKLKDERFDHAVVPWGNQYVVGIRTHATSRPNVEVLDIKTLEEVPSSKRAVVVERLVQELFRTPVGGSVRDILNPEELHVPYVGVNGQTLELVPTEGTTTINPEPIIEFLGNLPTETRDAIVNHFIRQVELSPATKEYVVSRTLDVIRAEVQQELLGKIAAAIDAGPIRFGDDDDGGY